MLSCQGHSEKLYARLDQEYDKVHGNTEGDSSDEVSKAELDIGSEEGGRSNVSRAR